jgi:hypothetical protein
MMAKLATSEVKKDRKEKKERKQWVMMSAETLRVENGDDNIGLFLFQMNKIVSRKKHLLIGSIHIWPR